MSDSTRILSLTCEHISSPQRPSNTLISIRATHRRHNRFYQRRSVKKLLWKLLLRNMRNFSARLKNRDYPATTVENTSQRSISLTEKSTRNRERKMHVREYYPFVTQYHPALPNLKNILMGKWHLIQNQPYLRNIFKRRKGKSLKDTLVRAKL